DNPMVGDPDSEEILIQFDQDFGNHNGGHIEFGPDGFLYIATGDGGSGNDPNNRAQDVTSLLGKMLRIDVSPETGYEIPSDNPFIFDDFGQDEIWSFGLRNPWKFAFDRDFGDMYIADVGQNAFEEVNFEPADAFGGVNYGWRCYEANSENILTDCNASSYEFPIAEYAHTGGNCSVTGGRIYRGPSFEAFNGYFFYTDLCSGSYWAVQNFGALISVQEFGTIGQSGVTSFGEDVWGEIYFSNSAGIHRLVDPNDELEDPITQSGSTLSYSLDGVSYEWFLNGELVGTTEELELSEVGAYTLILTTENGCQIESSIGVTSLSTEDYSVARNLLTIFPNPAGEFLTIDMEGYSADAHSLAIYSIDGRLIHLERVNTNRLELDLTDFAKGTYLLNLLDVSGNSIAQSKLIRE
ncbi:MAG: PQQ-dependent sugar dehydrogenase, partial [Cryomorphaceae bacterium]